MSPGVIKTPMHARRRTTPSPRCTRCGRMGEIDDIVEAVLYLESAAFVTGEILHVDGGQSAGH